MDDVAPLIGEVSLPGDKSISHRAAMFSVLAKGQSRFDNISDGLDVKSTIDILNSLGAKCVLDNNTLTVDGNGLYSLSGNDMDLDCGNSGTTLRLLSGLLSGQDVHNVRLVGDHSLSKRPQDRIIIPLTKMGANINGRDNKYPPIEINQSKISSCTIEMTIASAQVKSAVILAGLYANGQVTVIEHQRTRDHSENMLRAMGADITVRKNSSDNIIELNTPTSDLKPLDAKIPSDPSSAAFFGVAASIIPGSNITIKSVLLNPTRCAWIDVLQRMCADITVEQTGLQCGEPVGDIYVRYSGLSATTISGDIIASLIDELPILSLAMALAKGTSSVRDASELRVKESDRISVVVDHLKRAGISTLETPDGYDITGGQLNEIDINANGDHRIAMTFSILNYLVTGKLNNDNNDVISTSFPKFFDIFQSIMNES